MAENGNSKGTPKLRFPEFGSSWEPTAIARHVEECASRVSSSTSLPVYTSSRSGLKPQEDYYAGRAVVNNGEYGVVPAGCFVYRHMSDDGVFAFNVNDTGSDIAVSKEYPVFRAVDMDARFLLIQLNHSPGFKAFAQSQKAGGTRTRLYFSKLRTWKTLIPSQREQEKVADCLTSLEEVIAAQGRKVEMLKDHKRGLMQQLFPREGETRPRVRFPEFHDRGEWSLSPLGALADLKNGYAFKSSTYAVGDFRIVTIANVQSGRLTLDETKSIATLPPDLQPHQRLQPGDILISMTGNVGRVCLVDACNLLLNQRVGKLVPRDIDAGFFYQTLRREEFRKAMQLQAAGGAQGNLSASDITGFVVARPRDEEEQQRIAACLSVLDARIAAESDKLDMLKTHKKGLMQQLFPSAEGD